MRKILPLILAGIVCANLNAQDKTDIKFGKISASDFETKVYSIDSNAGAVVLADIGETRIEGNSKGWFSLKYTHFKRVHILNKNSYDVANVEIPLWNEGNDKERIESIKAYTYNLENGKVVETKIDKKALFKDEINKNLTISKFTFPNIKEGSIIEFEYRVSSDFLFNLQPWNFQGEYPRLWSEYNVSMPQFLYYITLTQGYQPYHIKEKSDRRENFYVSDRSNVGASDQYQFLAGVSDYRWVMKDVPALKEESYTSTLSNHIARIEFQLAEYREPLRFTNIIGSWPEVSRGLLKAEYFGDPLTRSNGWLSETVDNLVSGSAGDLEKAHAIYSYVRDNFTCVSHRAKYLDQNLKEVLKTRKGSVAEINLLLIAMLRYAGVFAEPVMLSTRANGYTYALYPLITKFNYVVARFQTGDKVYFLDASHPALGFGRLLPQAYNGHARIIDANATAISLNPDSLKESKVSYIMLINGENGSLKGRMQQSLGYYESYSIREKIKEKGKDDLMKEITTAYGRDIKLTNPEFDSLKRLDDPILIKYEMELPLENEDLIYFNPMFGERYKENPFKSAERMYPVEMPYTMDETFILSMQIPEGYEVDELPEQIAVRLNERNDGQFEYRISNDGNTISLRSRIFLKRSFFAPEEYVILREFFNLIVKKHNEQIVFKKKAS